MVERPLCMREVPGSIPGFSKIRIYLSPVIFFWSFLFFLYSLFHLLSANETQIVNQDDVFVQSIFNWRWNKGPCRLTLYLQQPGDREVPVKDDDIEVSDDLADMKSGKESSKLPSGHSLSKLDRNLSTPVLQ